MKMAISCTIMLILNSFYSYLLNSPNKFYCRNPLKQPTFHGSEVLNRPIAIVNHNNTHLSLHIYLKIRTLSVSVSYMRKKTNSIL